MAGSQLNLKVGAMIEHELHYGVEERNMTTLEC